MLKHEEKYCPRCHVKFTCKVGDIANCQCTTVTTEHSTAKFLASTFYGCLCKNCIAKIDQSIQVSKHYKFPTQKEMFIEGLHYYIENNNWVFTEFYHMLRGYCCQNGCRHCVYGFKIQQEKRRK